ncbi:MAG TPA: MASE1 domain-containing protein [Pyrinomonadaceae bacterium]|nr:MASE1 domain-containing protein [Pyrinomonadaceae bacterium]
MSQIVAVKTNGTQAHLVTRYSHILRPAIAALIVSIAYYVGAKIGFALTFQPYAVSTLWPPNAIVFAALLIFPKRWWWFLLLALLPAHLLVQLNANVPQGMIVCWFISNCTEALIGASVLLYLTRGKVRFNITRNVAMFIVSVLVGVLLSSFLDAAFVRLNQFGNNSYWTVFRMRFFSNVLASLTLVPLILTWTSLDVGSLRRVPLRSYLEAGVLAIGLLLVGVFGFATVTAEGTTPALLYLPLPFLLWATIRFGPRGFSLALITVSVVTIWGAIHGLGPFASQSAEMSALSVQIFLILSSMPLLFLAALINEREQAQKLARQNSEQNRAMLRAIPDMVFLMNDEGVYLDYHARESDELVVSPAAFLGKNVRDVLPEALADKIIECLQRSRGSDSAQILEYSLSMNGSERDYEARLIGMEEGKTLTIVRDVTDKQLAAKALAESRAKLHNSHNQIRELLRRIIDAQESERRKLSRELHDDLSQKIATLSVSISRVKKKVPVSEEQLIAGLDDLREETNRLTSDIRRLSHQLHPAVLEHVGLVAALESYIQGFRSEEQIEVTLNTELGDKKVPFQTSICIYRVAVEALRNVARHSGASAAQVSLKAFDNAIELEVSDTGKGFNVELARKGDGLGLVSIEERLRLLRGSCEIRSTSQTGTQVVARVPLMN